VLDREASTLARLMGALSPYAQGLVDLEAADPELGASAASLRALLEALYGQRLTFKGEAREPTGTAVTVRQALQHVHGDVVGAEASLDATAKFDVIQTVKTVEQGGSVTGFKQSTAKPDPAGTHGHPDDAGLG
jgi:hypothetical protein